MLVNPGPAGWIVVGLLALVVVLFALAMRRE